MAKMSDSDPQENAGDGSLEYVKLTLASNHDIYIDLWVHKNTQMVELKKKYSERVGVPVSCLRFRFDGLRIKDNETPYQLDMENDDFIDVYHKKVGGTGAKC